MLAQRALSEAMAKRLYLKAQYIEANGSLDKFSAIVFVVGAKYTYDQMQEKGKEG
jgi:hypothetical protein